MKTTPQDLNKKAMDDEGMDNAEHFHIFHRYDIIPNQKSKYLVLAALGNGVYGQVVSCQDLITRDLVAIKVVKYHEKQYQDAYQQEKDLLQLVSWIVSLRASFHLHKLISCSFQLNEGDPDGRYHIIRLRETFHFHDHGCLVFVTGGPNLVACLTETVYRGLSLDLVHNYTVQLLIAIRYVHQSGWVHADLKPDNVLTAWLVLNT